MLAPSKLLEPVIAASAVFCCWCVIAIAAQSCPSSARQCLSCDLVAFFNFDCAGHGMFKNSAPDTLHNSSATLIPWFVDVNTSIPTHGSHGGCTTNPISGFEVTNTQDGAAAMRSGGGMKIDLSKDSSVPSQLKNYTIMLDIKAPPEEALYSTSKRGVWSGKPNPIVSVLHFGRNPHSRASLAWSRYSRYPFKYLVNSSRQCAQEDLDLAYKDWTQCMSLLCFHVPLRNKITAHCISLKTKTSHEGTAEGCMK